MAFLTLKIIFLVSILFNKLSVVSSFTKLPLFKIAIINKGNLIKLDTTENLLNSIKTKKIIFKVKKINKINPENLNGIRFSFNSNNEITALYERKKHKIDEIINKIKNAGMEIYDISTEEGNLEDVFIDLTKS